MATSNKIPIFAKGATVYIQGDKEDIPYVVHSSQYDVEKMCFTYILNGPSEETKLADEFTLMLSAGSIPEKDYWELPETYPMPKEETDEWWNEETTEKPIPEVTKVELLDMTVKDEIKIMMPMPILLEGPVGCVDCDTEYLTRTGWRKISDYNGGDICIWNPDGSTKFEEPLDYIVEKAEHLIHLKTTTLDMMLSDGHRTPYITSKGNHRVKPFRELISRSEFTVPRNFSTPFNTVRMDISDELLRVLVMQSADGYFRGNICYINVKKKRKKDRVEKLLQEADIDYRLCWSSPGYQRYSYRIPTQINTKSLSMLWSANSLQAIVIYKEFIHWDGHNKKGNRDRSFTGNKENVDVIQFISSCVTGTYSNIHRDNRQYVKEDIYNVDISKRRNSTYDSSMNNKCELVRTKDGKEYCFTTSSTFWLARRNGKVFPTGNTGKSTILIEIAEELGLKYYASVLTDQTSKNEFTGYRNVMNGEMVRPEFREAVEHGGLYVLEELNGAVSNMPIIFNSIDNGYFVFADKIVYVHEDFRLCATMNTITNAKDFGGRRTLDKSVEDRFHNILVLGDMNRFNANTVVYREAINQILTNSGITNKVTNRDCQRFEQMISKNIQIEVALHKCMVKNRITIHDDQLTKIKKEGQSWN